MEMEIGKYGNMVSTISHGEVRTTVIRPLEKPKKLNTKWK